MLKKIGLSLMVLVATGQAQIGIEYSAGLNSQYFWRGYDLSQGKPILVPEVTISLGESGVWLDVWGAFNADVKEIDLTGAYYMDITETMGVDLGLVVYTYPGTESDPTFEPFAVVYGAGLPLEPEFLAAYDLSLETLYFDLGGSLELLGDSFPLAASLGFGFYSWDGYSSLSHVRLGLTRDFELGGLTVTPGLQINLVPQGFIDEDPSYGTSSSEIVLSVILSGGGE